MLRDFLALKSLYWPVSTRRKQSTPCIPTYDQRFQLEDAPRGLALSEGHNQKWCFAESESAMDDGDRNALRGMLAAKKLEPYISYIRFPHYKNLAPDLRIDFDFPITALVGVNGTNKSSILRAIQGAPGNENLGVYWFSTSTDPIADTGARNAFIYGYYHQGAAKIVEVLKTRVKKEEDPDYWEPSRGLASYGMAKMDEDP